MSDDDKESLKALVIYPEETRKAIFLAAQQPAALIRMKKIQERNAERFNEVISSKDRDTQRALWDLTRYPGLVEDMASVGPRSESRLVKALDSHPEIIRVRAMEMYNQQYSAVSRIAALKQDSDSEFKKLVGQYDLESQEAFEHLLNKPEVLSLLTDNMDLTVIVGDMYRQDPEGTLALATQMHEEVAEQNARELNDWRSSLEDDPEAMAQYEEASEEFATEFVDDDVYYSEQEDPVQESSENRSSDQDSEVVVKEVHHYHYNYPYWFSYPRWYNYAVWRPFPRRFHTWGFGWNAWGGWGARPGWNAWMGWNWGMPSPYFMSWYYSYPYHYYRYPNLACQYSAFTHRNRSSINPVVRSTRQWHQANSDVLPERLNPSDRASLNAVRELGKLETQRSTHNRLNPSDQLSRGEMIERGRKDYPTLANNAGIKGNSRTGAGSGTANKATRSESSANATRTSRVNRTNSSARANQTRTVNSSRGTKSTKSTARGSGARTNTGSNRVDTRKSSSRPASVRSNSSSRSSTSRARPTPTRSVQRSSGSKTRTSSAGSNRSRGVSSSPSRSSRSGSSRSTPSRSNSNNKSRGR